MIMSDWFIVILTAVLVAVTGFYAWTNRGMLREMRAERAASSRPHLALQLTAVSPTVVMVDLVSVGRGAAMEIDVILRFNTPAGSARKSDERRWRGELLAVGERRQFLPPATAPGRLMGIKELAKEFSSITVDGTTKDAFGNVVAVHSEIADLAEWDALLEASHERFHLPAIERIAKSLDKVSKSVDAMQHRWTAPGGGLHARTDDDIRRERAEWDQELESRRTPPR